MSHIALCLLLAACSRNTGDVASSEVRFSISMPQDITAEVMRILFFDSESDSYAGETNLAGNISGNVFDAVTELRAGTYDAFCYNLDIPDTFMATAEDKSGLYFYTDQVSSDILARCGYADGTPLHYTPDVVLGAAFSDITADGSEEVFRADAKPLVETWTIEVNGRGLQYAQAAGVVISGFPTTCHPYSSMTDSTGDVWAVLSITGGQVRGSFNVFRGSDSSEHSIVLNILDSNGKAYLYPLDCTVLMAEARRDGTMLIRPEASIEIPEPQKEETGGGFQPSLGDWNYEKGEIII